MGEAMDSWGSYSQEISNVQGAPYSVACGTQRDAVLCAHPVCSDRVQWDPSLTVEVFLNMFSNNFSQLHKF
jgi:hypothetical protein